ncbi:rhodanese-like domain-containing protein [Salinimicrobium gaetbulicola]|uniref:Rhodanese-like domain-containing protein n=1 Tax=Salinimicrobium gaetbulicola TaxID=999702 RepID=A0ABW3IE35_9FLAO
MKELSQEEWRKQISNDDNAVILDVRTELEVEEGYIPEAKNIDIYKGQEFLQELDKLDKEKNYYVYCRSGARSAQACNLMDQKGFKQTYNLIGGFSQWEGEKAE